MFLRGSIATSLCRLKTTAASAPRGERCHSSAFPLVDRQTRDEQHRRCQSSACSLLRRRRGLEANFIRRVFVLNCLFSSLCCRSK